MISQLEEPMGLMGCWAFFKTFLSRSNRKHLIESQNFRFTCAISWTSNQLKIVCIFIWFFFFFKLLSYVSEKNKNKGLQTSHLMIYKVQWIYALAQTDVDECERRILQNWQWIFDLKTVVFFRCTALSRRICGVLSANGKRPAEGDCD